MLSLLILILAIISCWLRYQMQQKKYKFARGIPTTEPCYPLIGNALMFAGKTDEERFDNFISAFARADHFTKLWFGPRLVLGTCHPGLIQQVLNHPDCIERPSYFYKFMRMTKGLLVANHKLWKVQRKVLNPTFNLRILHSFIPIFESCCQKLVKRLNKCSGKTINIFQYVSECTLEMVCGTTLGTEHLQEHGKDRFLFHLERLFEIFGRRILSLHLHFEPLYFFTPTYWQERQSTLAVRKYVSKIIQDRRNKLHTQDDFDENQDGYRRPQIFLDQILKAGREGQQFDQEEIHHNSCTMIAAGNDTSALAVSHGCLWLAMYPHIQDRVCAEIREHFPSPDTEITPDALKNLVYTEMFLKETLRLSSPAPNISRETLDDIELDGVRIPKGTIIILSLHALHRRADLWGTDADRFDPENFNPEQCQQRHPGAYLPFSGGARNCIGGRYAMISMKVLLIHILSNFKLKTKIQPEQLRYKFSPTLKLSSDHLVQLEKR